MTDAALVPDERDLVARARRNDSRAFETLYRLHVRRIYGLCLRLCGSAELAEDLTQEAFVLAWRRLDGFRGDSAFGSWLYRIATNAAISELRRRRGVTVSLDDEDNPVEGPVSSFNPEDTQALEQAIASLPDGARTVFVLYSIEGYKHDEIGSMLGIAVGSSKAQLHRARQLLKRQLTVE